MGSMGGGGSSGTSQQTQTQDPWSELQPYLTGRDAVAAKEGYWEGGEDVEGQWEDQNKWIEATPGQEAITGIFPEASRLYGGGPSQFYGGQTYAGFSPDTLAAQEMMRKRATEGSELTTGAQDLSRRMIGGEFLNANPYLDETFNRGADAVSKYFQESTTPGLASQYTKAGRYGSGSFDKAMEGARGELGETLSGMATDIYGGNYQRERDRQIRAMEGAEEMARGDYLDMGMLRSVGEEQEGMTQRGIDEAMARHDFEQGSEWENLNRLNSLMTGQNYGGSTTSTRPWFGPSQGSNIAGGLSTGLGAYGAMGAKNPYVAGGLGLLSMF